VLSMLAASTAMEERMGSKHKRGVEPQRLRKAFVQPESAVIAVRNSGADAPAVRGVTCKQG